MKPLTRLKKKSVTTETAPGPLQFASRNELVKELLNRYPRGALIAGIDEPKGDDSRSHLCISYEGTWYTAYGIIHECLDQFKAGFAKDLYPEDDD